MPLILSTLVRRWLLTAIALPLAASLLTAVGRRVERTRGPNRLSSVLCGLSNLASSRRSRSSRRRRPRNPFAAVRSLP